MEMVLGLRSVSKLDVYDDVTIQNDKTEKKEAESRALRVFKKNGGREKRRISRIEMLYPSRRKGLSILHGFAFILYRVEMGNSVLVFKSLSYSLLGIPYCLVYREIGSEKQRSFPFVYSLLLSLFLIQNLKRYI